MSEKEEYKDRMNANKEKPTDRYNKQKHGERRVRDPVTGGEVIIKDADPKDFDAATPAIKPSNILMHPFPPPQPASLTYIKRKLNLLTLSTMLGLAIAWFAMAFGHGFWRFFRCSVVCGGVGGVIVTLISLVSRNLEKEVDAVSEEGVYSDR